MATRRRPLAAGLAALIVVVLGAGCSGGDFGDFVAQQTTTSGPRSPVTVGGSSTTGPTTLGATSQQGPSSTGASPATVSTGPPQTGPPPPSQPVATGARTEATASNLSSGSTCEGGRPVVKLAWAPVANAEQVVAVSSRPDGLDSGNFTSSETLSASASVYVLRETQPGGTYYWRVLTKRASGVAASETAQFQVSTC